MDTTEIITNIGILVGTATAAWIAYKTKNPDKPMAPPATSAIVGSIGLEIGNKDQAERMIAQLTRIADSLGVLADREREAIEEKLDELLVRMAEKEAGTEIHRRR